MTLPHILIPVKSLAQGKSRLAGLLDAPARRALTAELAHHAISVAVGFTGAGRCAVVSHCFEVLEIVRARGVQGILHRGSGLNAAVTLGLDTLRAQGAGDVMVIASDLPMLRGAELQDAVQHSGEGTRIVVGTDRHGEGTNLLYVPAGVVGIRFHYGPHSLALHLAEAQRLGWPAVVHRSERLGFDVDTPDDFLAWQPQHAPLPLPLAA